MSSQSFRRDSKAVKRKNDHRSPAEHRHSEDVTRGRDIPVCILYVRIFIGCYADIA